MRIGIKKRKGRNPRKKGGGRPTYTYRQKKKKGREKGSAESMVGDAFTSRTRGRSQISIISRAREDHEKKSNLPGNQSLEGKQSIGQAAEKGSKTGKKSDFDVAFEKKC